MLSSTRLTASTLRTRCPSRKFCYCLCAQLTSRVSLCRSADGLEGKAVSIAQVGVIALAFSPASSTLFTFERPVKSETEVYKNVKAWSVETGEQVGGWYHKTGDDW